MWGMKATAVALVTVTGSQAWAQGYDVRYDMQLWAAHEQMMMAYGGACQMGDQQGCAAARYLQDLGGYLMYTNDFCVQGNQQACADFQQAYGQLDYDYGQFAAYYQPQMQVPQGGVNPLGATHEERMQNIHNWGQGMLAQGNANQAILDQRHADFMATIND